MPGDPHYRPRHARPSPTGDVQITRVSVIDHRARGQGLVLEIRGAGISTAIQDEGRTLKVWVDDA